MKKIGKTTLLYLFSAALLSAAPVDTDTLNNVALNFASSHGSPNPSKLKVRPETVSKSAEKLAGGNYKIIHLQPTGWVIVSTDDVAKPILAYNLESNRTQVIPENFKNWMTGISEQIEWAKNNLHSSPFADQWKVLGLSHEKYLAQHQERIAESGQAQAAQKGPLLQSEWNQGTYYNAMCPADADGPDGHVWAGCVATAMVQIMKYYNWPNVGKGSHSYDSDYGTLSANFGATHYHWNNMPLPQVNDYNDDVATIMYHAGVAVDMQYSPQGSGAYVSSADYALKNYFRYFTKGQAFKNNMSDEEWKLLLKKEIDGNRPIFYAGYGGSGGHAFVCDGYNFDDSSEKFHFNWGWSGHYDGYYEIGALEPGSYSFNDDNEVIYGIRPMRFMKAPSNLRASNITKTSVVLRWEDKIRNEKGFKIYKGTRLIKRVPANTQSTRIGRLIPGTKYTLRVSAYRGFNESRRVPVVFKTLGKRPGILPLYMNQTLDGKLTDRVASTHRDGSYAKYYTFTLAQAKKVTISLNSTDFDTYLILLDGRGKANPVIASDDDGGEGTNSMITIDLEAGKYTIEATSYTSGVTGSFSVSLKKAQ